MVFFEKIAIGQKWIFGTRMRYIGTRTRYIGYIWDKNEIYWGIFGTFLKIY